MMESTDVERSARDYYETYLGSFEERLNEQLPMWNERAERLRTWAQAWVIDGYLSRDIDVLASLVTDDLVHQDPMNLGHDGTCRDDFRRSLEDSVRAFPDFTFLAAGPPSLSLAGDVVLVPWRAVGTFTGPLHCGPPARRRQLAPTGRGFDFSGIDQYAFRGDKVSHMRSFYDPVEVAVQLGLLPPTDLVIRLAPLPQRMVARVQRVMSRR